MGTLVLNFALAHKDYAIGVASCYAFTHIPEAVAFLFHLAMKWPLFRAAVVADPAKAKAIIDAIAKELEKDIDDEVLAPAPATPQNPLTKNLH